MMALVDIVLLSFIKHDGMVVRELPPGNLSGGSLVVKVLRFYGSNLCLNNTRSGCVCSLRFCYSSEPNVSLVASLWSLSLAGFFEGKCGNYFSDPCVII